MTSHNLNILILVLPVTSNVITITSIAIETKIKYQNVWRGERGRKSLSTSNPPTPKFESTVRLRRVPIGHSWGIYKDCSNCKRGADSPPPTHTHTIFARVNGVHSLVEKHAGVYVDEKPRGQPVRAQVVLELHEQDDEPLERAQVTVVVGPASGRPLRVPLRRRVRGLRFLHAKRRQTAVKRLRDVRPAAGTARQRRFVSWETTDHGRRDDRAHTGTRRDIAAADTRRGRDAGGQADDTVRETRKNYRQACARARVR